MSSRDQADQSTSWSEPGATEFPPDESRTPVVLSVAGFDPSSGAGITADLKVFAAFRIYGMSCITALTVQSTQGVQSVEPVAASIVTATLEFLARDVDFSGIKLGMLATEENCAAIERFLQEHQKGPVVLDPVIRSSSGKELLSPGGLRAIREKLLARVDWITPNLDELALLTDLPVKIREDVPGAATALQRVACQAGNSRLNVLVTGGHLERPDDFLLQANGDSQWILGEAVRTAATHGTGCAFSSALLCCLVSGNDPVGAATLAKKYVVSAMQAAYPVGHGRGPMHHLFAFEPRR